MHSRELNITPTIKKPDFERKKTVLKERFFVMKHSR